MSARPIRVWRPSPGLGRFREDLWAGQERLAVCLPRGALGPRSPAQSGWREQIRAVHAVAFTAPLFFKVFTRSLEPAARVAQLRGS